MDNLDELFDFLDNCIKTKQKLDFFQQQFTPEVEKYVKNGNTLLKNACQFRNLDVIQLLIHRNNSSLVCLDSNKNSILHFLCYFWCDEYINVITSLLNSKPELIFIQNLYQCTVLHTAAINSQFCFLEFVLDNGYITKEVIDLQNDHQETCLFYLVRSITEKSLLILKKCIKTGANIFIKNNDGNTILDIATQTRQKNIIDYLMSLFENNLTSQNNLTNRNNQVSNIETIDDDLFDFLVNCIQSKQKIDFFNTLFTPEVENYMKNGNTLLSIALRNQNIEVVNILIQRNNSPLNCLNSNDDSILHLLSYYWNKEYESLFISLLDNKPELISLQNTHQNTFLHIAIMKSQYELINISLNHKHVTKEIIDLQNYCQETCLFQLVRLQNNDYLQKCIEKCANICIKNNNNHTILNVAKQYELQEIINYLDPLF